MILSYHFKNPALLQQALTHPSFTSENPGNPDNQHAIAEAGGIVRGRLSMGPRWPTRFRLDDPSIAP